MNQFSPDPSRLVDYGRRALESLLDVAKCSHSYLAVGLCGFRGFAQVNCYD